MNEIEQEDANRATHDHVGEPSPDVCVECYINEHVCAKDMPEEIECGICGWTRYTPFNWDSLRNSMSPAARRNSDRSMKVFKITFSLYNHIPWMKWPVLSYVYRFWHSVMEEGIVSTCKPRYGMITFGYLNDGIKPTFWHSWRQLTHEHNDKYTGIYTMGAPKSLAEAQAWEDKWEAEWEAERWAKYGET